MTHSHPELLRLHEVVSDRHRDGNGITMDEICSRAQCVPLPCLVQCGQGHRGQWHHAPAPAPEGVRCGGGSCGTRISGESPGA